MRKIELIRMHLLNFKGARDFVADFTYRTDVCGANATGKTTIFDAFTWCLFGKDSQERSDSGRGSFGIKTTDADGNVITRLDHEVELELKVDGVAYVLKRVMAEKWTQKRGTTDVEFTGNETRCFVNGVDMKISDYQKRISDDIIDEARFKAITNPNYVCNLPWEKQKAILAELIGNVTFGDIVGDDGDFAYEYERLVARNMVGREDEYLKSINASIRKSKDDIKAETNKIAGMADMVPQMPDVESLNGEVEGINAKIASIDEQLKHVADRERSRYEKVATINGNIKSKELSVQAFKMATINELHKEYGEVNKKYFEVTERLAKLKDDKHRELIGIAGSINDAEVRLVQINNELDSYGIQRESLLERWHEVNDSVFPSDGPIICPLARKECGDSAVIVELHNNRVKAESAFNEEKNRKLEAIEADGLSVKNKLDELRKQCVDTATLLESVKKSYSDKTKSYDALIKETRLEEISLEKERSTMPTVESVDWSKYDEVVNAEALISGWRKELDDMPVQTVSDEESELSASKASLMDRLSEIHASLGVVNVINEHEKKIKEANDGLAGLTQNLAYLEREADILLRMRKAVDEEIQNRCDMKFRLVKWKLSEQQINGGEVATCYAMANGVKYADQNSAMKVNMGLDIIGALCEHYGVCAPIFIDNAEGVNNLMELYTQMIRLVVTNDNPLQIINY